MNFYLYFIPCLIIFTLLYLSLFFSIIISKFRSTLISLVYLGLFLYKAVPFFIDFIISLETSNPDNLYQYSIESARLALLSDDHWKISLFASLIDSFYHVITKDYLSSYEYLIEIICTIYILLQILNFDESSIVALAAWVLLFIFDLKIGKKDFHNLELIIFQVVWILLLKFLNYAFCSDDFFVFLFVKMLPKLIFFILIAGYLMINYTCLIEMKSALDYLFNRGNISPKLVRMIDFKNCDALLYLCLSAALNIMAIMISCYVIDEFYKDFIYVEVSLLILPFCLLGIYEKYLGSLKYFILNFVSTIIGGVILINMYEMTKYYGSIEEIQQINN